MGESWYKKCMPRVADVRDTLRNLGKKLASIPGIKSIRIFGSFAEHASDPSFRIKDIDLIAVTPFHSEDLISVNAEMLSTKPEILDDEGFNVAAVKFSKEFTRANELPIDHWVISSDKKLLHWGPIIPDREESDDVKQQAEQHASTQTGVQKKKLAKASDDHRTNWYASYRSYLDRHFEDMPTGWYLSECSDVKNILRQAVLIS